jgi:hypothetical protein
LSRIEQNDIMSFWLFISKLYQFNVYTPTLFENDSQMEEVSQRVKRTKSTAPSDLSESTVWPGLGPLPSRPPKVCFHNLL